MRVIGFIAKRQPDTLPVMQVKFPGNPDQQAKAINTARMLSGFFKPPLMMKTRAQPAACSSDNGMGHSWFRCELRIFFMSYRRKSVSSMNNKDGFRLLPE